MNSILNYWGYIKPGYIISSFCVVRLLLYDQNTTKNEWVSDYCTHYLLLSHKFFNTHYWRKSTKNNKHTAFAQIISLLRK
jgi:hypothetical protein